MDIDVGQVVGGKYALVRLLGRGSMGEVWAAQHVTLGEQVALKIMGEEEPGDLAEERGAALKRFQFEAQVAARLSKRTRHIVRVTDHGEQDGLVYLVMELLEGETLEGALLRNRPLPPAVAADVVAQLARGLAQAHAEGVVHRDLKPANVFLSHDEDGKLLVKVLDFGIARAMHGHRVTSSVATARGVVFGTPGYMSPEQARGSSTLDHHCDLWALATIAYEAVTGELPVDGVETDELLKNLCAGRIQPVSQYAPSLADALQPVFDRAFSEEIRLRFQSAEELARAFTGALAPLAQDGRDPVADPWASGALPAGLPNRRRPLVIAGLALLGLLAAAAGIGALTRAPGAVSPAAPRAALPPAVEPVHLAPPSVGTPSVGREVSGPAVPVSALPRAPTAPPIPAPATTPAASATATLAAPPPPAPAKSVDKSAVF